MFKQRALVNKGFPRFLFSTSCEYEISPARKILLALHDLPEIFLYPVPMVISETFSNRSFYSTATVHIFTW